MALSNGIIYAFNLPLKNPDLFVPDFNRVKCQDRFGGFYFKYDGNESIRPN